MAKLLPTPRADTTYGFVIIDEVTSKGLIVGPMGLLTTSKSADFYRLEPIVNPPTSHLRCRTIQYRRARNRAQKVIDRHNRILSRLLRLKLNKDRAATAQALKPKIIPLKTNPS